VDLREEILAALAEEHPEGLTAPELLERCPAAESDEIELGSTIAHLRQDRQIKPLAGEFRDQRVVYVRCAPSEEQPVAAGRASAAPDKSPEAHERPVAPTPAAFNEEKPMSIRERVLAALKKAGPMTSRQMREHVDVKHVAVEMAQAADAGALVRLGGGARSTIYGLPGQKAKVADQPAPPQDEKQKSKPRPNKAKRKAQPPKGRGRRVSRPAPASRNGNGRAHAPAASGPATNGAAFAINEYGEIGIHRGNEVMKLDTAEFDRLREFIDRTKPIWNQ
jgi:hypothetical protein